MDTVAMVTGLLHDVVEDTSVTVEQVRKEFGDEVARCVDGVT
jgi:GTP pyrophosphokinase